VSSVMVDGCSIPAATTPIGCGYVVDAWDGFPPGRQQTVSLRGHSFRRGLSNIAISYIAGFVIQGEPQSVPNSGSYAITVNQPNGPWAVDQGVTYANGTSLLAVGSAPAQGQYSVAAGVYTFNAADAGAPVLISYSYIPADIEQAAMEMVGERYNYKSRIGVVSKSLGGQETMAYSQKDMSDFVSTLLVPYRSFVLV
jgi:hypothetical protein